MELLDGGDLRERAPLPWREACALLCDVCSSLALLHSRRLVHRDVSPRNVRCTADGRAKLIDFGAMVPVGPGDAHRRHAAVRGARGAQSVALDARTDLFSLGATLYYALTGRVPFPARSFADLCGCLAARAGRAEPARARAYRRRSTRWCCRCSASSPRCGRAARSR